MKKILLGTTGLVGAALFAAAASAETPKVTLGGFSDFQAGFTEDDQDGASNSLGFRNDNEISVSVAGKTDGGLGYGAVIDLEADITDDADNSGTNATRTYTYLDGAWGRAELGSNKSAAATMRVDASSIAAATGGINGAWSYFANGTPGGAGFVTNSKLDREHGLTTAIGGDESSYNETKVTYYTPVMSGFQAGLSYTPNSGDRGQTMARSDVAGFSNIWDLGLAYNTQIDNSWKLGLAGTYEGGESNVAGVEDLNAWNVGANIGFQGFSLAGSYGDWSDSGRVGSLDSNYWTAGLGYEAGPVGLSATYIDSTREETATTENDFNNLVLGADYKLAPGLTPYAEVSFYEFDGSAGAAYDNDGTSVILGTQVAF